METWRLFLTLSMLVGTQAQLHGFESSVCIQPTPFIGPAPQLPELPDQFSAHIECAFRDSNSSTEIQEVLDGPGNRGTIQQNSDGLVIQAFYNYSIGELLTVLPQTKQCFTYDLSGPSQRDLFGFELSDNSTHIYSTQSAFKFGLSGVSQTYLGKDIARGIPCDVWYSCQYMKENDASLNVRWYFADTTVWSQGLGILQPPVRCHVTGSVFDTPTSNRSIDHVYDIMHFRDYLDSDSMFETPHGVACPGRKNTKPFPTLSSTATYSVQLIDKNSKDLAYSKEVHDSTLKLTRYYFTPINTYGNAGDGPVIVIHDFNTGVQYSITESTGNCSMAPISNDAWDAENTDAFDVRMRTSKEFFDIDGMNMVYTGMHEARNIDCETWIGTKTIAMDSSLVFNATMEFSFVTPRSNVVFMQYKGPLPMPPVPFQYTLDMQDAGIHFIYNLFDYSTDAASVLDFDVSSCYDKLPRTGFEFQIVAQQADMVRQNSETYRYALVNTIINTANISPIRISNLRLDDRPQGLFVVFEINDVAPVKGDVNKPVTSTSLKDAVTRLTTAMTSNIFVTTMTIGGQTMGITLVPGSQRQLKIDYTATPTTASVTKPATQPASVKTQPSNPQTQPPNPKTQAPQQGSTAKPTRAPPNVRTQPTPSRPYVGSTNGPGGQTTSHLKPPGTPSPTPYRPPTPRPSVTSTSRNGYNNGLCASQSSGYSSGALAGLGIAMLLIGGAAGGGTFYGWWMRQ